ncbi:hypothetical protein [Halovenus salina]|uniref:Uncharacterized protein n=1 Tax=Halovenus salina TaxID=1510225 RepID=A0ABD5W511_9EURY
MSYYDPEAEATGKYMVAFIESAGKVSPVFERKVREIFEDHMGTLEADSWYLNADVEKAFQEVLEEVGEKTMMEGGVESGKAIEWPDDVETVMDGFEIWNSFHEAAYRNSDLDFPAGKYTVEQLGDREVRVGITEGTTSAPSSPRAVRKGLSRTSARKSTEPGWRIPTRTPTNRLLGSSSGDALTVCVFFAGNVSAHRVAQLNIHAASIIQYSDVINVRIWSQSCRHVRAVFELQLWNTTG